MRRIESHQYFMRGDSLQLDGSLGITLETLSAIPRFMGSNLETLVITDVSKFSDKAFASALKQLPSLRVLNLRYALIISFRRLPDIQCR